jgi:hypothetical protein
MSKLLLLNTENEKIAIIKNTTASKIKFMAENGQEWYDCTFLSKKQVFEEGENPYEPDENNMGRTMLYKQSQFTKKQLAELYSMRKEACVGPFKNNPWMDDEDNFDDTFETYTDNRQDTFAFEWDGDINFGKQTNDKWKKKYEEQKKKRKEEKEEWKKKYTELLKKQKQQDPGLELKLKIAEANKKIAELQKQNTELKNKNKFIQEEQQKNIQKHLEEVAKVNAEQVEHQKQYIVKQNAIIEKMKQENINMTKNGTMVNPAICDYPSVNYKHIMFYGWTREQQIENIAKNINTIQKKSLCNFYEELFKEKVLDKKNQLLTTIREWFVAKSKGLPVVMTSNQKKKKKN